MELHQGLAAALLAAAAVVEVTWRRVPNALTLPAVVLGLGLAAARGLYDFAGALAASALGAVALWPFARAGAVGPGILKLVVATGALAGWRAAAVTMLAGTVAAGCAALLVVARTLGLHRFWVALYLSVPPAHASGHWRTAFGPALRARLPYAPYLAAGYACYLLGRWRGWW